MNVIELVESQLKLLGADGLVQEYGDCGCMVGDLAPCGQIDGGCIAARNDAALAAFHSQGFYMLPMETQK